MAILKPKNFDKLPFGYRPRKTLRVPRNFAKKVRGIRDLGGRADDEDIADVISVMENMKTIKPNVFTVDCTYKGQSKGTVKKRKHKTMKKRRV